MNKQSFPSHWANIELAAVMPKGEIVDPSRSPKDFFELWSVPSFPNAPELLKGAEIGSTKQKVQPNDVLLCKINPRINRVWRVLERCTAEQIASSEWIVLRSLYWDAHFIQYYLTAPEFRNILTSNVSGVGGSLTRARPQDVKEYGVPLPPLNEQRRIAAKIEELQSRSKKAREALAEAETLLEQLRQSVLHAAFTGKLTEAWRKANPNAEPADKLLERIRIERRKRWEEAELAKYAAKGKTPLKGWQAKYPNPVQIDTSELPELPEGWCWASLDECIYDGPTNGYSPKTNQAAQGTLSLKLSATSQGFFLLNDTTVKPLPEVIPCNSNLWLQAGDLLIQRANTIDLVGTAALYNGEKQKYIYPDLMSRVRLAVPELSIWTWKYINSSLGKQYIKENATGTAGNMPKINASTIRNMPVPIPCQAELQICTDKLMAAGGKWDSLRRIVKENSDQLTYLDQSILAKAFRGELVPQDPNDEPASELLKRIKAESTVEKKTTRRRKSPSMPEE